MIKKKNNQTITTNQHSLHINITWQDLFKAA